MKRTLSLLAVLVAPSLAWAQATVPAAPTPPATTAPAAPDGVPLQQFLERRVVEELAAEGTVLGRLGYSVRIQITRNLAEISLIDTTSGRMVRATKIDNLAKDRDAALATVTQVVANLVAQQAQVVTEPVPVPSESPREPAPRPRSRSDAEAQYAREAIGFGTWISIDNSGTVATTTGGGRGWRAWQGELRTTLTPTQFYQLVGRPDLERERQNRSSSGSTLIGLGVAGYVVTIAGGIYLISQLDHTSGPGTVFGTAALSITGVAASGVVLFAGIYKKVSQPINEAEAKKLAQKYNDDLRRKYGLPVAATPRTLRPEFRLTGVAPYVAENHAGVAVQLSF